MVEAVVGGVAKSAVGSIMGKSGKKKASKIAQTILPKNIDTGNSQYNTQTGKFTLDPSIRTGQDDYTSALTGFRGDINAAFSDYDKGLGGLKVA